MKTTIFAGILILLWPLSSHSQEQLGKIVSIHAHRTPLTLVLQDIGKQGSFYFSYNTNILNGDSLVSLNIDHRSVRQILDTLLGGRYEYIVSGRYLILQVRSTPPAPPPSKGYTISGWVVDSDTRRKISRASIYAADQLISTLTDSTGFFRLKLKDRAAHATITVSKDLYRDTFLVIRGGYDQEYTLIIEPMRPAELLPFVVTPRVERTWLGKFFLSSREKIQSLNLLNFFASKPVQMSLTPGLGTHGQMGGQVVNKFSLNILGGYTAGSNGVELAGCFNIDKRDVNYLQAAGLFNLVGGKTKGVQLAGLMNKDLDSVTGFQAAGLINRVNNSFEGVQLAGLVNSVSGTVNGFQASGVVNYARNLKGVQLGLVNISDSCSGLMIGLLNITRHGYHSLSVSSNEILPVNIAYKAGGRKFYSIMLAGLDLRADQKSYMFGFGFGYDAPLSSKWSVATEMTAQYFYPGSWTDLPVIYRLQPSLVWHCGKKIAIFAGPSFSLYDQGNAAASPGYKLPLPGTAYHSFRIGSDRAWFGWTAGVNFF